MYLLFIMSLYSLPEVCSDFLFLVVLLARRKKLYKHIHNLREIQAEKGSCSKTSYKGRFTRYDFVAYGKFTTGLRRELFRLNQTYNSLTTVMYDKIIVLGF